MVVSNSAQKAELFTSYFASQCTPVINKSQSLSLEFKTRKKIEKITFIDEEIHLIIKNLNVDKGHGWNNISIRIIKHCGKSIALPLSLIFQSFLNDRFFPDDWKKGNVLCHKKDSKNFFQSLAKCLNDSFITPSTTILSKTNFLLSSSLALCPVMQESCSYYQSLMKFTKVSIIIHLLIRGAFLDILKAFDKV